MGPVKILFLGNSITRHEPKPEIKWFLDCGMAATALENDYVHQCVRILEERFAVDYRLRNVAAWERGFSGFDYASLDAEKEFACDILVLRISENIDQTYAKENEFKAHYEKLIDYVCGADTKVILSTNFWGAGLDLFSDKVIREVAADKRYRCAELNDLGRDIANKSYPHDGFCPPHGGERDVCEHPGDRGMLRIAKIVANQIIESLQ